MGTDRTLVAADQLVRHYRVQKDALRFGRFGLGWFRREFETVKAIDEISFFYRPRIIGGSHRP